MCHWCDSHTFECEPRFSDVLSLRNRFTALKEKIVLKTIGDVCLRSSSTVCRIPMPVVVRADALVRRLSWL